MPEGALSPAADPISCLVEKVLRTASPAPVVTLSWAQSQDGAIAPASGRRVVLSGPESMTLTHRLRGMHDAILVGIGTVLSDDPQLTVRLVEGRSPRPIVLDAALRLPVSARLLSRDDHVPWIFHAENASASRALELSKRGARLFAVSAEDGALSLDAVLHALEENGIATLMVEGGAHVLRSFLGARRAHQAVITISPVHMEGLRVFEHETEGALDFDEASETPYGKDVVRWGTFLRSGKAPFSSAR